ncbi:MAG TPA: hypothetical protein PLC97_06975 [Myxococcota bacterium]|nr:hypothetical protein [Myxococcota bacterium]HHW96265.1 hypothetical protein [Oligoflexales bacterium]HON25325.1 hypothetical protein [Myxococcota bacterium]HQC44953.1 hypothetical protein [Myxococcota bacterium]
MKAILKRRAGQFPKAPKSTHESRMGGMASSKGPDASMFIKTMQKIK